MYLKYKNFLIRNAEADDAALLCKWWNDGNIMAHAGFPHGLHTNTKKIIDALAADSDNTCRRLIMEADSFPIGEMSYRNKGENIAEIGIKICESNQQEKGYGSILLKMLITSLFNDFSYKKIILDTNLENTRAQHVYEKLGFRKVKINCNSWKNQVGELQSTVDYELSPNDFLPLDLG